jgi:hypothetical protein
VSVYVDRVELGFGRMKMCHMIADTPAELHAMADRIGIKRRWFQAPPKASFWHYDIAKSKRALALAAGAIDCDRNTFVAHLQRIRESGVFARPRSWNSYKDNAAQEAADRKADREG